MTIRFLTIDPGHVTELPAGEGLPERCHEFEERTIGAVNAALAAKRPLLVRGEPGLGKTQLAEAAAEELDRAFYPFVVDSRTESRDLLWRFDAVLRLADAQLCQLVDKDPDQARERLEVNNYIFPGPLWWAYDWASAESACADGATPLEIGKNGRWKKNGWVVLIDEIDKAETDVPNGLLEALGSGQFTPMGRSKPVKVGATPPLVIITTNEERVLPDAFLRRCLVLQLELPKSPEGLVEYLVRRGRTHFKDQTSDAVLTEAAEQLVRDRQAAKDRRLSPLPGQAEYLDLVRAVIGLAPRSKVKQKKLLDAAACYTLQKHPELLKPPPPDAP